MDFPIFMLENNACMRKKSLMWEKTREMERNFIEIFHEKDCWLLPIPLTFDTN
jgi:hypothetical protein